MGLSCLIGAANRQEVAAPARAWSAYGSRHGVSGASPSRLGVLPRTLIHGARGGSRERMREPSLLRPIALLSAAAFASVATMRAADPLLPQVAREFGVSAGEASIIATAFALAYGFCQLVYGVLGDRFGKYRLITLATLASALTVASAGFAGSLGMLGAARLAAAPRRRRSCRCRWRSSATTCPTSGARRRSPGSSPAPSSASSAVRCWAACSARWSAGARCSSARRGVPGHRHPAPGRAALRSRAAAAVDQLDQSRSAPRGYAALLRRPWTRVVLATVCAEAFLFYGAFTFVGAYLHEVFGLDYAHGRSPARLHGPGRACSTR